ncbi:MAG: SoxR reducing system RseC family protein [Halieaceae bacterium]|nr:SoxR reducing system RseC family protein [Halieaceae bacterium]
MLTETGRVVGLEGDAVWVETLRQSTCGSCAARSGCGHGLVNAAVSRGSRALVEARRAASLGDDLELFDTVELSLPERSFLTAAAALYGLPIAAAVAGALLAQGLIGPAAAAAADLWAASGALGGVIAGLALVRWLSRRGLATGAYTPEVTARLQRA